MPKRRNTTFVKKQESIKQESTKCKSQDFSAKELQEGLGSFFSKGFSYIRVNDTSITENKKLFLDFLKNIAKKEPDVLFEFLVSIEILEKDILQALLNIGATILIDYNTNNKKLFAKRIRQLNENSLSFGFIVLVDKEKAKSRKNLFHILEEIVNYYPNHVYFQYAEDFSTLLTEKDSLFIQNILAVFELFYTEGRAVPWFKSLLLSLKISSFAFISDFYEWLISNNYIEIDTIEMPFYPFEKILKMQLQFVHFKLEEKKLRFLFPVIEDILRLHAAFSQVLIEGEEKTLDLHYHPEDILNQGVHFLDFYEKICVENTTIRIYLTEEGIDYAIL